MAQKVQVLLEDDLSGGPADTTVRFGLDGAHYEIDLNEANSSKLHEALQPYVQRARKAGGTRGRRARGDSSRVRSADIRTWA